MAIRLKCPQCDAQYFYLHLLIPDANNLFLYEDGRIGNVDLEEFEATPLATWNKKNIKVQCRRCRTIFRSDIINGQIKIGESI